ncbi:MAG: tail fiber domain-containing protein, partial [Chromatiales bacterium]|nr:tail fiber domain-containing protein [Chromatiales bacterium]
PSADTHASTAIGYRSAYGLGSGDGNTTIGESAGADLNDGEYNTFVGARAGEKSQDSISDTTYSEYYASTFVGALAGLDAGDGASSNTFLGAAAGSGNQTGDSNIAIGAFADFGSWDLTEVEIEAVFTAESGGSTGATVQDASPKGVAMVGAKAEVYGDYAVGVGYGVQSTANRAVTIGSAASSSHIQAVTIGYGATSHADYGVVLGNSSTTQWDPHADGVTALGSSSYRFSNLNSRTVTTRADSAAAAVMTLTADAGEDSGDSWQLSAADSSDLSFSNDISGSQVAMISLGNGGDLTVSGDMNVLSDQRVKRDIEAIPDALRLVKRLQPKQYYWKAGLNRDGHRHYGLIAQDIESVLPEVVEGDQQGWKSVNYLALLPLVAQGGGELAIKNQQQAQSLQRLDQRLARLEQLLGRLKINGGAH